jgi:hypothetical protein
MTHFRDWLSVHLEQTIGFVGGFSYGLFSIHLSSTVHEFIIKLVMALFVGFITALGGWLFKLIAKWITPKKHH